MKPFTLDTGSACNYGVRENLLTARLREQNYDSIVCGLSPSANETAVLLECCDSKEYDLAEIYHLPDEGSGSCSPDVKCAAFISTKCRQPPVDLDEASEMEKAIKDCMLEKVYQQHQYDDLIDSLVCFHPRKLLEEEENKGDEKDGSGDEEEVGGAESRFGSLVWAVGIAMAATMIAAVLS